MQLRLEALEARLKLKKLQQKKLRAATVGVTLDSESHVREPVSRPYSTVSVRRYETQKARSPSRPKASGVQVAVSPPRKQISAPEAKSPGRVLLGIDKGLTGKNISLRRMPGAQSKDAAEDPFTSTFPHGTSRNTTLPSSTSTSQQDSARPKSFSERIAETRRQDRECKERQNRLRKQRSMGFGVQQQDLDAFKESAESNVVEEKPIPSMDARTDGYSREEVLKAVNHPTAGLVHRSNTVSGVRNTRRDISPFKPAKSHPDSSRTDPALVTRRRSPTSPPTESSHFEPYSSIHLSKRLIPHPFLSHTIGQKHISLIPSLLATIKSPAFALPEALEDDFVVFGVIASKSSPLAHKDGHKSTAQASSSLTEATDSEMNARGKYMVFTLTDLEWSLDLYLFTTAYTRFWKLTPGTLIAILNPSIMPPPPGKADTGRFSLVLNSSDDTILEIGISRDLGWCKSVRRDGKNCGSWVDKRHTEYCEWHVDRVVEGTRRGRMEVNGMSAPYAPGGKKGGRTGFWGGGSKGKKDEGLVKEGAQYDRGSGSKYFIAPTTLGPGRSAASLLDAEGGPLERGGSKEERVRKRLAEREREREIARRLGEGGNGLGGEYLRLKHDGAGSAMGDSDLSRQGPEMAHAGSLGLLGNKARDVHLSPLKKRKGEMSEDGVRKKTRFVTAGGVKEAGRESLGGVVDEEDELDIV